MTPGRGKHTQARSPNPPGGTEDRLLTSEDLFGDMVDDVIETEEKATARSTPIKVRVNEPGGPADAKAKGTPEVLPPEVAALLDAFSGPAEAAMTATPHTEKPAELRTEEVVASLLETISPGPPEPRAEPDHTEDVGALLDRVLSPDSGGELPAPVEPAADAEVAALLAPLAAPPKAVKKTAPETRDPATGATGEVLQNADENLDELLDHALIGEAQPAEVEPEELDGILEELGADDEDILDGILEPFSELTEEEGELPTTEWNERDIAYRVLSADEAPIPFEPREHEETGLGGEDDDADDPSLRLLHADLPGPEAPLDEVIEVASRTGTKFQAVTSLPSIGSALDLAGLAEKALGPGEGKPPTGDLYGPYTLLEKIAIGGMADVFRAKRSGVEGFEKIVAVKRILPHLSDNKEFVDMFINEAKMVAGLTHPNIVQIFDLGKIEKTYYLAMEYIHGRDLRSIQKRAAEKRIRIPLDLTVHVVGRVCAALEYAHRKKDAEGRAMKIVHRDISPQNILLSFEGDVKLTDFGIAKAASKAPTTDSGALRGKLLYMSPEQAWGRPMDRRSDLFSLGIVLYELVTDEKPFLGTSETSILELVRECRIAPPRSVNPRVPERLERVVMKALEREPEHRYQNATQMYRDLERVLPERKAATAVELARFMEVLFETGQGVQEAEESESRKLEVELDSLPQAPPAKLPDSLSIQKLLKRFGIK